LPFAEVPIKLDFRSRHGGKGERAPEDEPEELAAETKAKPKPKPKAHKPARKKKGEKSELWDV
jgi:hypothetical protein